MKPLLTLFAGIVIGANSIDRPTWNEVEGYVSAAYEMGRESVILEALDLEGPMVVADLKGRKLR